MKAITTTIATVTSAIKNPNSVKFTALILFSLPVLLLLLYHLPSFSSTSFSVITTNSPPPLKPKSSIFEIVDEDVSMTKNFLPPPPPPPPREKASRIGIVDENGFMSDNFKVGELDPAIVEEINQETRNMSVREEKSDNKKKVFRFKKFRVCDESKREYIPCLDNVEEIQRLNLSGSVERFQRHCPVEGKVLDCLVPVPKGYQKPILWPKSRDEVWFSNVPHTRLVEDKGGQNWIAVKGNKFIFPGGGTQFIHGADQYLNQISLMVPDISFGVHTRTALDVGCGVASFGAFLLGRNVTAMSIAPKDVHENQIQFALERGVPAMVAVFGTQRLLYPSQAFDLIHCSRCRIDWISNDGILLLEANRMLRAGGYFVWAAQPVYKHEKNLEEQWKEMLDLTSRICWKLVKKEGYIAIWQKPVNNTCYLNRIAGTQPPLCDSSDDPDNVWYVSLKACITPLPDNGYGANVSPWPTRLHNPPDRLQSIKMEAYISRNELLKAESRYWNEIIDSYVRVFRWKQKNFRNVMDMRAGLGGFAEGMHDLAIDCWVMNVVPVSGFNTLPVIYDRGLIGVMHDWCEPFDTYPRTYDLLHASGLFSDEKKRQKCSISSIMLEMDRMLRPEGTVYIRDKIAVVEELEALATAMGWMTKTYDIGEGPHSSWKILICEKRM